MSGYNPESQVTMRLGLDHWVLFVLPSTHVLMISVPHLDTAPLRDLFLSACGHTILQLFQEHRSTDQHDTDRSLDTRGTDTVCEIGRTVTRPYFSVTRLTINGSYIKTTKLVSLDEREPSVSARRQTAFKTDCGSLKQLWRVCDASLPEPVVSDSNLRLHVQSREMQMNIDSTGLEGLRVIFTFHQVCSLSLHMSRSLAVVCMNGNVRRC